MKIGFDAKRVFHNFRGLGNYSRTLIEGLLECYPEHEYHLYTPVFGDARSLEWRDKFAASRIHTPQNFLAKLAHPLWRSFGLSSQVKKDGIDIYHGLSHEIPYGLTGFKNLKTVVTVHDLIFMRYPEFFPWIDRQTYARKLRYATERADAVLAICEQTKQDLMDFLYLPESKITVVYQACSPDFYPDPQGADELNRVKKQHDLTQPFLLSVGALEARKNLLTLLDAFAIVKDKIPHQLVLVGKGRWEYRRLLEAKIVRLKLESRVKILGAVAQQDLPLVYRASDAFVYPSLFEGFGLPIVEAMFCQTPVITSRGGCFPESGGPSSRYVDPRNVEDLASAIQDVVSNRSLRDQMIIEGSQFVQKFHLKQTSKKLIEVYQKLSGMV